jgi:hypothetical protein
MTWLADEPAANPITLGEQMDETVRKNEEGRLSSAPPLFTPVWQAVSNDAGIDASARDSEKARVRREVNLSIYELSERIDGPAGGLVDFLCECGGSDCLAVVCMTLSEFRQRVEIGEILARQRSKIRAIRARHHTLSDRSQAAQRDP